MSVQVRQWLIDWFVARGKIDKQIDMEKIDKATFGQDKIGQAKTGQEKSDSDYFAAGWLTSMEVVEFVMEIEQHFSMQFSDRDLQDPRFVTISGLSELILERSTETSDSR